MKKLFTLALSLLLSLAACANAEVQSFAVTDITYGNMVVGRCTAPVGSEVKGNVSCGTTAQSISNPWAILITATTPTGTYMSYNSAKDFIQILRWDGGTQHQEGVYNAALHTTMLSAMDASAYCDYWAQILAPGYELTVASEYAFPEAQEAFEAKAQAIYNAQPDPMPGASITMDGVYVGACSRLYTFDYNGVPSIICIICGAEGIQTTTTVEGVYVDEVMSYITWDVPFTYSMICTQENFMNDYMVFEEFVENTSASDQFKAANERLGKELWDIVTGRTLDTGNTYSESVLREETASGDDYEDKFTDYLFDQNDYTLSDGSHVKVSTTYDYVYQGTDGNVYYSDSAFAEPGGATRLYPNQ